MFDTILVPTDGSEAATVAARCAIALANRFDATVHALHIVELDALPDVNSEDLTDELRAQGTEALDRVEGLADERGLSVTTTMLETASPVHEEIVEFAADDGAELIVMGTHGRTGVDRLVLGSVAERTLRVSPVPVLTVHEDTVLDPAFDSVLVPTDGSDQALAAAELAIDLATATGATLHIVHVVDATAIPPENAGTVLESLESMGQQAIDAVIERAEDAGVESVQSSLLSGSPSRAIFDYADERGLDLVVMGTRGRTGLDRYLLGSVTEKLVRIAEAPVLTISPAENE